MVNAEAQRRRVIDNQLNISAPLCLRVQFIYFLHNPNKLIIFFAKMQSEKILPVLPHKWQIIQSTLNLYLLTLKPNLVVSPVTIRLITRGAASTQP